MNLKKILKQVEFYVSKNFSPPEDLQNRYEELTRKIREGSPKHTLCNMVEGVCLCDYNLDYNLLVAEANYVYTQISIHRRALKQRLLIERVEVETVKNKLKK
jgi:intergrase/recombinase